MKMSSSMAVALNYGSSGQALDSTMLCLGLQHSSTSKVLQALSSARRGTRLRVTNRLLTEAAETAGTSGRETEERRSEMSAAKKSKAPTILIAGGGIGGLVLALAAKNKGLNVKVFERDLSAVRGEGQYRGPIQIQSNALAALEAVDAAVAEDVMEHGCITGDRINGLVDGLTGKWYVKFDTFTPAAESGLPVTRVISRMKLQEILARAVGPDIVENNANVVDFKEDGSKVTVTLQDGRVYQGDMLVGADGIRSKVRAKLLGVQDPTYSGYTCYTGIANFVPADIDTVGYRVFLGHKQYFVSSDVGHGMMQWYAFHNEPAGGTDPPEGRKQRLLKLFGHWCDGVTDLLHATPEEHILRRDIFDRIPIMNWSKGRVTLLGDAAHAMQPNMGQGGCMAIEDAYQLALEISKAFSSKTGEEFVDVPSVLQRYEYERRTRVGIIHGMARMAAIMASTYKPYLGEGLGPLSILKKLRIPHPGRVGGRFFVNMAMPIMLRWVLGGNSSSLEDRVPSCRLTDKANDKLRQWFLDDDALERATTAEWYLLPDGEIMSSQGEMTEAGNLMFRIGRQEGRPTIIGSSAAAEKGEDEDVIVLSSPQVSARHAKITFSKGACFLTDLGSEKGTWITNVDGARYKPSALMPVRLHPGDVIQFGSGKEAVYRVKLRKRVPPLTPTPELSELVEAAVTV